MAQPITISTSIGLTSSLLLSGIYAGSSFLTVPLLYPLPTATATTLFKQLFYSGAALIVPIALGGTTTLGAAAYLSDTSALRLRYAAAALLTLSTLLWTQAVMSGNIQRLIEAADSEAVREKLGSAAVVAMLRTWHWQNLVRAGLAFGGGVVALGTLVGI